MTAGRPEHADVVIVGAGPTGISAAIMLADRGVDVLVLDRWTGVYPRPRAVSLDDEIFRILARMGLAEEFAAISRPALGLRLIDGADHRVLGEIGRAGTGRHGYPEASMFDQPELERLLRSALRRRPGARIRGDAEVTGIVRHDLAHGITVQLTDRVTGRDETITAGYVLGCDGANSVVRDALGSRMEDLGFTQRWLVVDLATGADLGRWEGIHQVCSAERAATYMRISDDRYRWEFQLADGESAADHGTVHALRPLLRPWLRGTPDEDLTLLRVTDYTFRAQLADRWQDGRVLLLGDAAHLTPPFIGQGMGAGLRDAANLSWKLAGVLRGELPESDLDSYQAERRPHARAMIRQAVSLGRVMTGGGHAGDVARRTVLPRLAAAARPERFGSGTPALGHSSLVRRPRGPLRSRGPAGSLCPNAEVRGAARLDEIVGGRFAVVTDTPVGPARRREVERAGAALVEVTPADPLGRWLRDGGAHAVLVRPDATVLASGQAPERVLAPLRDRRNR
ncbi:MULTISPECIES: bifunctional 3-(3-hydroxy-phenyl)propionate/3-hydroxycinnamic acid hydroxylase [unclassified Pseudonocardia]|uniref:bifunctional 3-(3-hydroxy-phenyl)propionate/3-hydroxycinnamic acid hydroxylase MhpA n=1 Tax=unclassified Pseudonocardia TaxID=2619320 RepID=UPI0001FFEF42|nr:bifunctional 3-(3-hydroxy-phenyl)propionate/3-hydroxycinnamic acid hydroxylase [Pseudonocardia sp. Ae707_Ps1]OLM17366.1 3-(3-hydroxy-phenyl)propionate hydroxylase [Pseudonocardia sp. Ae707_Ps1]